MKVADVDREAKGRRVYVSVSQDYEELLIAFERVDEHSRLRLDGHNDLAGGCEFEDPGNSIRKSRKRLRPPCPITNDARPNRNAAGIKASGDIDRAAKKVDSPFTTIRVCANERRLVLRARIE